MPLLELSQLRLGHRSHIPTIEWTRLLYRVPQGFHSNRLQKHMRFYDDLTRLYISIIEHFLIEGRERYRDVMAAMRCLVLRKPPIELTWIFERLPCIVADRKHRRTIIAATRAKRES
jgi:hypothetical protein